MQKTKRILALLLVVALTVMQMPVMALANGAGEGKEVVAFDTLPEETANQAVSSGSSLEDLDLPNPLNATVHVVTAFEILPDEIRWQNTTVPQLPAALVGTVSSEAVQIPVTWETEQDYDENAPERGLYVFDAVPSEGYTLAGGVEAPCITVYIPEMINHFTPFRMGGSGTDMSPLEITTAAQLTEIAELVNAGRFGSFLFNDANAKVSLKLMNDLDLSGYGENWNSGKGWKPIGTAANPFKGSFDGSGNSIRGLHIKDCNLNNVGLFGSIEGGTVENLILSDVYVLGLSEVGGVAGRIKNTIVKKCSVTGSVSGGTNIGGVVGTLLDNSGVENCYSVGSVNGTGNIGNHVGGIAGSLFAGTSSVQNCYSAMAVKGEKWYVGGIAGYGSNSTEKVKDCAALGPSINAQAYKGRVAGWNAVDVLSGNTAFSGMTGGYFVQIGPSEMDGENITAAEIKADGTIGGRFTAANGWTVKNGKLPGFGSAVDMPDYITGGSDPNFPGAGTSAEPFLIGTAAQFAKLAELVNNPATNATYGGPGIHYKLTADIDLSGYGASNTGFNSGKGWVPIGTAYSFRGDFNGGGNTIAGLYINDAGLRNAGLFGDSTGSIHDLHLEAVCITAEEKVGGIAGQLSYIDARIERCSVSGTITGKYDVGGIAGYVVGGMTNCFCACDVTGQWQVGGVVGNIQNAGGSAATDILSCYAIGTVIGTTGGGNIGGVAGRNTGNVRNCAALNPTISGPNYVGRVVGRNDGTLSGNAAFSDMVGGGSYKFDTGLDGADTSADAMQSASGFPSVFATAPWTYNSGSLPGLFGKTVAIPAHITAKLTRYFTGGGGSESDPYQIATAAQLAKLAELVNKGDYDYRIAYYKLIDNIDLSGYGAWFNEGKGWVPIGNNTKYFTGNFNGNKKTITGLYINDPARDYAGLFGCISGGSGLPGGGIVYDLIIKDAYIKAGGSIGGIVGYADFSAKIEKCFVSGMVSGSGNVGGVVGRVTGHYISDIVVSQCASDVEVSGSIYVGGVVGHIEKSVVKNCYATGTVRGSGGSVGGIGGQADTYYALLQNCYATGSVSAQSGVGGIAGLGPAVNCVAMNPSIKSTQYPYYINRVTGSVTESKNNYAFSGMADGGSKGLNGRDGADMSIAQANTAVFWTTAANWYGGAWDENIWNLADGKLPTLKNLPANLQSGDGGVYLTERDIANATVEMTGSPFTYTGSPIEPTLIVIFDGKALVKGTDYIIEVVAGSTSNGTNPGAVTAKLVGKGNFTGEKTGLSYNIQPRPLTADMLITTGFSYNGKAQKPAVTDGAKTLVEDVDYTAVYTNNTNAGTASISVTGKGNYSGTLNKTFIIAKAPLTITGGTVAEKTYNGTNTAQVTDVNFGGLQNSETLTLGDDYTITGAQFDNADAGENKTLTAAVALESTEITDNYTLTSENLSLTNQSIAKANAIGANQTINVLTNRAENYDFALTTLLPMISSPRSLGAVTYLPSITANTGNVLDTLNYTSGETLTIPVQSISAAGKTATITVTVSSTNYKDFTATITVKTIDEISLTITGLTVNNKAYDGTTAATLIGTAVLVATNVQAGDEVMLTGTPSAAFADANVGSGKTVTITGLSLTGKDAIKYSLDLSGFTGTITAKTLIDDMVTLSGGPFTYIPYYPQMPTVTVTDGRTLVLDTDYKVVYINSIYAGNAIVEVTGKGNYSGVVSKNFTIEKATPAALTWPNASAITFGLPLSASNLTGGSATGTWAWANETIIPPTGSGSYEVIFTPADTANYDWSGMALRQNVPLIVNKAGGLTVSTQPSMNARESVTRSYEFDMDNISLNKADTGAKTYNAAEDTDVNNILSNVQVDGSKLTYAISNIAAVGDTATVIITISTANYEDVSATLTVTVTEKETQTIDFEDSSITKTYGEAKFTQMATEKSVGGSGQITYASDNTAVATVNTITGEVTIVGAGSVNISATKAADDDWYAAIAVYGLTVNKKTITITAHDETVKAGQSQPAYTYTTTGLLFGESLVTEPAVTCPTADMSTVGTYTIVPSGAVASSNYTIQYQNGTLTVSPLSTACVMEGVVSPAGSTISGTSITVTVVNSVSSELIDITVSADAAWSLYSDASCTSEITNKTMVLLVGTNTAYIKVTAEDGITATIYTVIITRSSTGSGDSGGGGGSIGSSSGSDLITTGPEKQPDQPVTAATTVNATAGIGGNAEASIPDKVITDAIAKAQAEAKKQGKSANGIGVSLDVEMPQGASSLSLTLSQTAMQSLTDANAQSLEISSGIASLSLDLEALNEVLRQSTGNVTITIKPVPNLSVEAKKLIGTRPVYDVTISCIKDGKMVDITSLAKGSANLSFPYTPGNNEAAGYLYGVYVDGKGNATRIPGSAYDANSGSIIFSAGHFSVYGVGYTAPTEKYTDLASHWAKDNIDYVVGRGLFSGTADTQFSPNIAMDRGMLMTVLGRMAGADVSAYKTSSFSDVAVGKYYLPYVEWAYKKGIISGFGGKFAPERSVTREEISLILQNYAKVTGFKLPITREVTPYADVSSIGSVFKTAVTAMQQSGIMEGGSGNKFNPKAGATRAEVAAMLHRYIKLTIDPATAQGWAKNDAGQYLYYENNKPLTGWQTIGGVRYFFNINGTLQTGWVKDGDNWRFYDCNRALVGWFDIGSGTSKIRYYFDINAVMISGKWFQIDGKWHYFYADGSLAVSAKIDGYEVDGDGVRIPK